VPTSTAWRTTGLPLPVSGFELDMEGYPHLSYPSLTFNHFVNIFNWNFNSAPLLAVDHIAYNLLAVGQRPPLAIQLVCPDLFQDLEQIPLICHERLSFPVLS
jgi:hypothetical protein